MKENNPFMAHKSSAESNHQIPSHPLDSNHPQSHPSTKDVSSMQKHKDVTENPSAVCSKEKITSSSVCVADEALEEEDISERERLKRHRVEVAGRVWIPEIWGQEELLKDWIDCTAFDAPLVPSKITMARNALVEEGTRANVAALRIENRDLEFNVHMDLSLNNCTNGDVQNTQVFRRQEEHLNKKI